MAEVFFVRHGERADAVEGTRACPVPELVSISQKGRYQSFAVCAELARNGKKPDLIVLSPFRRTLETALPTIQHFHDTPVEMWDDAGEFTYLTPSLVQGTTAAERFGYKSSYWQECNPARKDTYAESFSEFVQRVRRVLDKLSKLPPETQVYLFGHEQFIHTARLIAAFPKANDQELMTMFRTTMDQPTLKNATTRIKNGQIVRAVINERGIVFGKDDKIKPEHLTQMTKKSTKGCP
jgi:probable phosphoglycerate mutase